MFNATTKPQGEEDKHNETDSDNYETERNDNNNGNGNGYGFRNSSSGGESAGAILFYQNTIQRLEQELQYERQKCTAAEEKLKSGFEKFWKSKLKTWAVETKSMCDSLQEFVD